MTTVFSRLRNFSENELIFDESETRDILKFFFPVLRHSIDTATITTQIRNVAQGLLVEAIDATYALGYIEIILEVIYGNPGNGVRKALMKIGNKAARHWFKHVGDKDLRNAKIAEAVRQQLSIVFKTPIKELLDLDEAAHRHSSRREMVAYVRYEKPGPSSKLWG